MLVAPYFFLSFMRQVIIAICYFYDPFWGPKHGIVYPEYYFVCLPCLFFAHQPMY